MATPQDKGEPAAKRARTCSSNPDTRTCPATSSRPQALLPPNASNEGSSQVVRRVVPGASLNWADILSIWTVLSLKEATYQHSPALLQNHPGIAPRDRAMVLEWIMEVCQAAGFFKETYYLAQDLFDRCLLNSMNIARKKLQLVGTSAIFLAAKVEEKTAPYATAYSQLSDGFFKEKEITHEEKMILRTLDWKVTPATVATWLTFQLQLMSLSQSGKTFENITGDDLTTPIYSQTVFISACRLLDLCMLDVQCLEFNYSVLAACSVNYVHQDTAAFSQVVLPYVNQLQFYKCKSWMSAFAEAIRREPPPTLAPATSRVPEERHLLQQVTINLNMLDVALGISKAIKPEEWHKT